jgi:hypothetical protein
MLLGDFMSSTLDHRMRRRMISSALRAAIGNSNTKLVHFVPTMQFLDAKDILTRLSSDEEAASPTYGFLNVRLFRIFDTPGDVVMDTLGLSALGLTDIQIRCRNLEPKAVAGRMHSLGRYLFEHGDVIETGDAVEGIAPGERWRCRHQESLLAPKRLVIDIDPGDAFASGNRRHA